MRLLKINNVNGDDVDFELVKPRGIPSYAILSHTWGDDSDELSFEDLENGTGREKNGYQKVKKFLAKTWQAGLEYAWADTCCIDKRSSAELSEAINSMFHWYKNAQQCCIYLFDFPEYSTKPSRSEVVAHLLPCRWFKRGWTLQELLAPSDLVFYSRAWQKIGDGNDLANIIASITHIPEEALMSPNRLGEFSIAQRMSWASKRETTRPEDIAYCLMGIFDVNMPLLYGEGNKAFIRLQEHVAKDSDDQSIFCWQREPVHGEFQEETSSFWAASPRDYQHSSVYQPIRTGTAQPFTITNAGLQITGKLQVYDDSWRLFLNCYNNKIPHTFVKLPLKRLGQDGDQFLRIPGRIERDFMDTPVRSSSRAIVTQEWSISRMEPWKIDLPEKPIYISKKATLPPLCKPVGHLVSFVTSEVPLKGTIKIVNSYPSAQPGRDECLTWFCPLRIIPNSRSLTNYSWHAAIKIRVLSKTSEPRNVVAFIGFNGRQNEPWCELRSLEGDKHDLVAVWKEYGFSTPRYRTSEELPITSSTEKWVLRAIVIRGPEHPDSQVQYKLVFEKLPEA